MLLMVSSFQYLSLLQISSSKNPDVGLSENSTQVRSSHTIQNMLNGQSWRTSFQNIAYSGKYHWIPSKITIKDNVIDGKYIPILEFTID